VKGDRIATVAETLVTSGFEEGVYPITSDYRTST